MCDENVIVKFPASYSYIQLTHFTLEWATFMAFHEVCNSTKCSYKDKLSKRTKHILISKSVGVYDTHKNIDNKFRKYLDSHLLAMQC